MHPAEIETALEGMVVLVDTREQNTASLHERVKHFGKYERAKLDAGDYSAKVPLPDGNWRFLPVAVERKMSLDELIMCYTQQRARFKREFERAKSAGIKLYLLVENASWENAYRGLYRSKMRAKSLIGSLLAWMARYDCQLIFCRPQTSGQLIYDILYREAKEDLIRSADDG